MIILSDKLEKIGYGCWPKNNFSRQTKFIPVSTSLFLRVTLIYKDIYIYFKVKNDHFLFGNSSSLINAFL